MANVSQLIRRQSSRELSAQKSIDRLELELEARLVPTTEEVPDYGSTNHAFEASPPADTPPKVRKEGGIYQSFYSTKEYISFFIYSKVIY